MYIPLATTVAITVRCLVSCRDILVEILMSFLFPFFVKYNIFLGGAPHKLSTLVPCVHPCNCNMNSTIEMVISFNKIILLPSLTLQNLKNHAIFAVNQFR